MDVEWICRRLDEISTNINKCQHISETVMDVSQNNSIRKWNCTFGKQYLEIGRLLCLVELLGATWIHEMNFMTFNEMCFSLSLSVRECVVVINNKYEEIWSHNLGETSKSYYQREFLNTITNSLNMYIQYKWF